MSHKHPSKCNEIRKLSMVSFKKAQQECYDMVDQSCVVKLKCVQFDNIVATTPKAVLIGKDQLTCWVPRALIESIGTEDAVTMYMWVMQWFQPYWQANTPCPTMEH